MTARVVTVYRVEHAETHEGPYSTTKSRRGHREAMKRVGGIWGTPKHPGPEDDGCGFVARGVQFCGFTSQRATRAWWHRGALRLLCEAGFVVAAYRVPADAVRRGGHQCLFHRDRALSRRVLDHQFKEVPA